jgi:hypothetical protein
MTENDRSGNGPDVPTPPSPGTPAAGSATPPLSTPEAGSATPPPPTSAPAPGSPTPPSTPATDSPPPYVPAEQQPPRQPANPRGQIRQQQPGVTQPRSPSLAEQRARAQAEREQVEAAMAAEAELARKKKLRKRLLIGGGVTVGVVALVAVGYAALSPSNVTATCVTNDDVVVQDDNFCDESYATSHGGHVSNGFIFLPIGNGGYNQYRYNYGGTGVVGQKISGGTTVMPPKANITTRSGSTVQRGGFGVSSGGSKSGTSGGS